MGSQCEYNTLIQLRDNISHMSIEQFIEKHRREIDEYIIGLDYGVVPADDEERAEFIMNDEMLYYWAADYGVDV